MELFIYLLKATGCTAAFYIVYYTLLRKLTFFSLNRWYLLSALLLSLAIPAMHISIQTTVPAPNFKPLIINTDTQQMQDAAAPIIVQRAQAHIDWLFVATCVYWLIAGLLLFKLMISLYGIFYKAIKYGNSENGYRLINGLSPDNSSFFKYIFLNGTGLDTTEKEQVIAHELLHARQLHSADNLFIEVLKTLLWFNPFIYLFAKALGQVHEFEVDCHLANRYNSKNYAGLLLKLSSPGTVGLINQFSAYGLKSRIGMLFSKPSATAKKLSYLLVLPVVLGLIYFLSVDKVYAFDVSNKNFVVVLDAGHGGKDKGANGINGLSEKDLNLQLVQQIKAVADERGIKTVLTRTDDKDVSLANRLVPQGDIFVSVHVNWAPLTHTDASGIYVITSDKNKAYQQSQNLAIAFAKQLGQLQGLNTIDMAGQNIYVLSKNKLPAVVLELGYMSNKNDMKYLLDKQYQHNMAEKFVDAVIAYKKSVQPDISGAVSKPDASLNSTVAGSFITNNAQILTDTAVKIKNKKASRNKKPIAKGQITTMRLSYEDDGFPDKTGGTNLYDEFTKVQYSAKDSTRADLPNKTLYLYGKAQVISAKFNIAANQIRINRKDSMLYANGNVHMKINEGKPADKDETMDLDSLTIDLRNHAKPKVIKIH